MSNPIRNLKIKVMPISKPSDVAAALEQGKPYEPNLGIFKAKIEFDADPETIQKMVEYIKELGEIIPPQK